MQKDDQPKEAVVFVWENENISKRDLKVHEN
jgi:hypothetical protein